MIINIEKNLVDLTAETADEKVKLETLWNLIIDCAGTNNKKLVPVGEYAPHKNKPASFLIEGLEISPKPAYPQIRVEQDSKCYCQICNKLIDIKKGDTIPPCCGKLMELMD